MSRSGSERLRDVLDCVEGIGREAPARRCPDDLDVAQVALDAA